MQTLSGTVLVSVLNASMIAAIKGTARDEVKYSEPQESYLSDSSITRSPLYTHFSYKVPRVNHSHLFLFRIHFHSKFTSTISYIATSTTIFPSTLCSPPSHRLTVKTKTSTIRTSHYSKQWTSVMPSITPRTRPMFWGSSRPNPEDNTVPAHLVAQSP